MIIDSQFTVGRRFIDDEKLRSVDVVKNEPMFFNASPRYAMEHGGPITRAFISCFIDEMTKDVSHWLVGKALHDDIMSSYVFDSRVHMLMPGWFPCIPGFHHDDVPRSREDGQPNYTTPEYRSNHCMGLVNGEICPTEFALGEATFDIPPTGEIIYKHWHEDVVRKLANGILESKVAPSERLVFFNDRTWHQGTQAVQNGWRWFGRISWDTDRSKTITNEIRRQVQVYMPNPMEGW